MDFYYTMHYGRLSALEELQNRRCKQRLGEMFTHCGSELHLMKQRTIQQSMAH